MTRRQRRSHALIPLLGLLVMCGVGTTCEAWQTIYKWKDASGTMHYSEQAPPPDVKKTRVTLSGLGVGESTPASAGTSAQANEATLKTANQQQMDHLCTVARTNLKLLDSSAMITSGSDISTATQLRGDQREKARVDAKSQVAQYCHGQ
jgi:hypothetical protein